MVARIEKSKPLYRSHCSWAVLDQIVRKDCLHVDVFLWDIDDKYFFVAEYRLAGMELVRVDRWQVTYDRTFGVPIIKAAPMPPHAVLPARAMQRHTNTPWMRRRPWLKMAAKILAARENWKTTRLRGSGLGIRSTSTLLHYIRRSEDLANPMAGLTNYHAAGGRGRKPKPGGRAERTAARKAERFKGTPAQAVPARGPAWNAKQRSLLRTLDKLIKY